MNACIRAQKMTFEPTTSPPPNRQAFAILAREHHRGLLTYARSLLRNESSSADLVQDAFVTAWRNLDRFDATRDFGAWMRGIVRNKWREHLRKHSREVDIDDEKLEVWEARFAKWDEARQTGKGEMFDQLEDCLERLPEPMHEVVDRYYYRDEPSGTIASALEIGAAALRKRLQRAREALRDCLEHKTANHA